ncbi:MAG: aminotransferase class V-fold PLP-dependent enzyme [Hoeflea sp.]|uniref:aminotransferase class V-fold PLP-dependent enzyme n=1 Tax=Hoeflea sp. TaxID=1940281 RepID=UPI001D637A8A|nr:aminotransferase class V-fold PLP-dependent enzyme [Hoeflea sp.]MBU4531189.1 aminotransferase class V-fold PLP-dependent enzyme [Alphaproteobacteria bacterium]MBU4545749.1 aminotransferase class V-fold PLP-dependent enzyme [Alphaproteobacteria bacterium]MBU4550718.1 aminotransferase class V-fold PLP-dependent enzyme [Alphaproteobacteria bacterium]MBV1724466.1 aminotransferase class V-fold PLP-dependent enzyme [Hoeflea sp.]MBV1760486.1 aminotransferase class V-fold PLP-dependent enzyme [Hoef
MNMIASPVDPDGLMEFSVVFTDRSLNHMSKSFQGVMTDLHAMLCEVYQAEASVIVPGGGTFGMESVARQFASDANVMVIRNGWFSYRWTQIFEMGGIPAETTVLKATQAGNESTSAFAPQSIETITAKIRELRPSVVFAPHVETSSGVILPDEYLIAISQAARDVGALFVLDCIASGCVWVDMKATGVDVLISAPQKGWSASPCAGLVMLGARALERLLETKSSSFALDLRKWHDIMQAYVGGGHAYHATMPTDALKVFRDRMIETRDFGFELARDRQWELGNKVRALVARHGFKSVAAPGFEAPGVVVSYTRDPEFQNGKKFVAEGMQIAAGVPLMCDEPADFRTFRIGLFGLDKLGNVDATVARLETVLDKLAEG